jgi:hypothetical protein
MATKISDFFNKTSPFSNQNGKLTYSLDTVTRNLPNAGGSYESPSVIPTGQNLQSSFTNVTPSASLPVANRQTSIFTPVPAQTQAQTQAPVIRSKYINPTTGKYFTPEEYANNIATKIPVSKNTGDIGRTAGDMITRPDQSAAELTTTSRNLNNARNDIAVGATDPYKAGTKSGIAFSPEELGAIEKAYAGVYDPLLNDVFTKLEAKQKEEESKTDQANKLEVLAKQFEYDKQLKSMSGDANGLTANQIQSSLDRINDDFRMDPAVQQYTQAAAGWDTLAKINPEKATSADDISAIYAFAKIMDPGSVVREGEYATVQKYAQSWAESFGFNAARIFSNTKFLSPQSVKNLQAAAKSKAASLENAYNSSRKTFEQRQNDILNGKIASGLPNYGYQTSLNESSNLPPTMVLNGQTLYLQSDGTYE